LQTAQPWLQHNLQECRSSNATGVLRYIKHLHKPTLAVTWLQQQLQDLQQFPDEAAAARVPSALLQELKTLADSLAPRFNIFGGLCLAATGAALLDPAKDAAVFQAFLQACAEGWLPEGLQQLGAKVSAAWPQKYACNDDLCLNMSCLTEHSCGRSKCTACKVREECA
jgi:hypothetical protein